MSVTAFDNEAASKSLEDAGFTDVQIAALMGCMRQSNGPGERAPTEREVKALIARNAPHAREGSIGQTIAMLVLGVGSFGALIAILIRVA
jgi:hypothetical protein